MTRVAVSGAAGAMGRLTCAAVVEAEDLELTAVYSPSAAGQKIAGMAVSRDPSVVWAADVVVEFTRPDVVMGNLAKWRELGVSTVVGTSGFDAARVEEVRSLWGDDAARCLIVPNFSIGAVVAMRMAELAAPHFPVAEVIEFHHDTKVDAPSGTALATAQRIGAVSPDQARKVNGVSSPPGALGADVANVRVHSVQAPRADRPPGGAVRRCRRGDAVDPVRHVRRRRLHARRVAGDPPGGVAPSAGDDRPGGPTRDLTRSVSVRTHSAVCPHLLL